MKPRIAFLFELAGWTALASTGTVLIDQTWWGLAPPLQAMAPWAWVLAAILGVCALALAARRASAWALCLTTTVAMIGSSLIVRDHTSGSTVAGAPSVTVVSFNTKMGTADPRALLARLTTVNADVIFLLEADRWFVTSLDQAGAISTWPYRLISDADAPEATVILSRTPLGTAHHDPALTFVSWDTDLIVSGIPITLKAVHVAPPLPGLAPQWHSDLHHLVTTALTTTGPMLMAGDFNADAGHPAFRALCSATTGLSGCGTFFSRPTWGPFSGASSILPLDHILVRGLTTINRSSFAVAGSDHRAITATLRLREQRPS